MKVYGAVVDTAAAVVAGTVGSSSSSDFPNFVFDMLYMARAERTDNSAPFVFTPLPIFFLLFGTRTLPARDVFVV